MPVFPRVETRFGPMFTLQGDMVIGRSLRLYGEFAGDEVDSILALTRPGDHVLDLGANIGFHTLAFARTVGAAGRVTAVEPQRYCFQLLCANVTLNQYTQVHCLRGAVGDEVGSCQVPLLHPTSRQNAGATKVSLAPEIAEDADTVPIVTVDSLGLARCDLIKIDTEGFEDRVVAGAAGTLAALRPVLYIELHDREKFRRVKGLLQPLGYSFALHQTRFFRAGNANHEIAQIFAANSGGTALIALPPGRSLPDGLPGEVTFPG